MPPRATSRVGRLLCGSVVSLFVTPLLLTIPWRSVLPNALQSFVISVHAVIICVAWRAWIRRQGTDVSNVRWYPATEGALALFVLLAVLSAWFTSAGVPALDWFSGLCVGVLLYLVGPALVSASGGLATILRWLSTGGALLAVAEIVLWNVLWSSAGVTALPTWLNPNYGAQLLLLPWFATLHDLLAHPAGSALVGLACRFGLVSAAILMSRSRAVWLGIVVALLGAVLVRLLRQRSVVPLRDVRWRSAAAALMIVTTALIAVTLYASRSGVPTPARTVATLLQPFEGSAGGRLKRWQNALPMVREHLWLGVGPGRWLDLFPRYRNRLVVEPDETNLPLNAHLGLLGENGVLAFVAFWIFVLSLLRRRRDEPPLQATLRLSLVAWLVAASFHTSFRLRSLLVAFWLNLALLAATRPPTRRVPLPWPSRLAAAACVFFIFDVAIGTRFLSAALHDYVATSYVRYAGDQPHMDLPRLLRPAQGAFERLFSAAFYREHADELRSISRWATGKPQHVFARIALREMHDGRCASALGWLESAERATTESAETQRYRCVCERRIGHAEAARDLCTAGLVINDRDPFLHSALGDAQVDLGESDAALRSYADARRLLRESLSSPFGTRARAAAEAIVAELDHAGRQDETLRRESGLKRATDDVLETIAWTPQAHKSFAVDASNAYVSTNASGRYQIWRVRLAPDGSSSSPELLTNGQAAPFRLRLHPTRRLLYFVADEDGNYEYHVHALDLDASKTQRLTSGGSEGEYEISPDGRWLAFTRQSGGGQQVCVADTDGRDEQCLPWASEDRHDLTWHPDAARIVFVQERSRLVEWRPDSGEERTLLEIPGHEIRTPSFAPTGDRLAFVARDAAGTASIDEITLATGNHRMLTPRPGQYLEPIWLDAERLLFRERVDDDYELRQLAVKDGGVTSLGPGRGVIYPVELSADRGSVFFLRSNETTPIVLERLALADGRSEQLLRIDHIDAADVISAERWPVAMGERQLRSYLYSPRGAAPSGWPCVIWLHGVSNEFSPRWHPYAQYFAHAGFVFAAFNFSEGSGLESSPAERDALHRRQVEEVRQFRHLLETRTDIDPSRVFLVGVSVGSRILQDVLRADIEAYAGAVEYSPIASPAWQKPRPDLPPLLEFIGDNDRYLNLSARLKEIDNQRRLGTRVEVVRYADEGHDLRGLAASAQQLRDTIRFLRSIQTRPGG